MEQALLGLAGSDRALAHALAMGTLRHLSGLDSLIDSACARPLPADSRARQVLRVALAGRLLLETPLHAAIATALPLLEGGPRRLAHGVLSTLFRRDARLPPPRLPPFWEQRWREAHGDEEVAAAAARLAEVPPTDLSLRTAADTGRWAERLGAVSLADGHLRLSGSRRIEELPGFAEGEWWVQDLAASLPARLLGAVAGRDVLDLCAAPGGKTLQLAAAGARVTALDRSGRRLRRLGENLRRTGLAATVVEADARAWQPQRVFDSILLDAPCSATGTFRRHPDLLYRKDGIDLGELVALQTALLERAARWLKPGGRLVYAVCSLERAEGEEIQPPPALRPDPIEAEELPPGVAADGHRLRTMPSSWAAAGGADGFFIARYRAA